MQYNNCVFPAKQDGMDRRPRNIRRLRLRSRLVCTHLFEGTSSSQVDTTPYVVQGVPRGVAFDIINHKRRMLCLIVGTITLLYTNRICTCRTFLLVGNGASSRRDGGNDLLKIGVVCHGGF